MAVSYTQDTAGKRTGLPVQTINAAIRRRELPAIRSGRRYIILHDDLVAWLRQCKERGTIPPPIDAEGRERLAELNYSGHSAR
jgi:excisionase family DNA binding protein